MTIAKRLINLREQLRATDLDAVLISSPENRRYLSGFAGSAGYLLVSEDAAVLATDFRYVEQASRQAPEFRTERISSTLNWFPKLTSELGVKRVGFEGSHMTVATHSDLVAASQGSANSNRTELISIGAMVDRLRAVKDAEELDLITRAVKIADQALEAVVSSINPGTTELEIAWELEQAMRQRGAEAVAFDIIVGSGANGALPHHHPSDRAICEGEPVVIDMGASYLGYCSDLSRTIILGKADEMFDRVYNTVLRAQLTAEERVTTGMTGGEVDAIARTIIAEAGYGDNFGHSLGHGIGLAVHEHPRIGPGSEERLEDGMVFTIEPGIYLSGWGGVRIEDMAVLENGQPRILSRARK